MNTEPIPEAREAACVLFDTPTMQVWAYEYVSQACQSYAKRMNAEGVKDVLESGTELIDATNEVLQQRDQLQQQLNSSLSRNSIYTHTIGQLDEAVKSAEARAESAETLAALRKVSEDTAITCLGKVENELAEAKQWIEELKASESAELAKLKSDVKPLLEWFNCYPVDVDVIRIFLAAHPEFRKDEKK